MGRQVDQMRRNIQNLQEADSLYFNSITHMNSQRFPLKEFLPEKLTVSLLVSSITLRNSDVHYRAHKNRSFLAVHNKVPEVLTSHPASEIYCSNIILPSTSRKSSNFSLPFRLPGQNVCTSPPYRPLYNHPNATW